ncbi:pentatricopeptide repeat-containing protein At1g53600, mitochondrial [Nicotiana sylvestris]|uniref:Pentatricopeptide repeat-containing protein At1g53600, mitochondrial-like n=2 Tax=Nicotiana TaxID=4085 RepID=A0A1S4CLD6_TOBAC|nr:PREDICTED: pentatricopeptide repeat-containing protein At1g53600, mitochondrial [Nicotiana sylvestris]XP_016502043.1 PREDICTED: pentatricopeptide repeat-containing protein At1g53600, mitochondrial-like [Nicotiana tabacum]
MLAKPNFLHVRLRLPFSEFALPNLKYSTSSNTLLNAGAKTNKFLIYCNTQIANNGRNGNIKEAESIFNRMATKNIVSWTAMLTAYSQNGQLKKARALFDEMPERSVASWNAMLTAYMRNRVEIDGIFSFFQLMPERNSVSFAAMITGFVNARRFDMVENLYNQTPMVLREPVCSNVLINGYLKVGKLDDAVRVFDGMVRKDIVSCSAMIDGYCKNGRVIEARELFDAMKERNEVTWGAMIDGYMKVCCFKGGFELFLRIRREGDVRLEPTILTIMFEACGRFSKHQQGYQVHGLVFRLGFEFDVFLGNSLITMYSRFCCVDAAKRVFDSMLRKDVISWNSLITAFVQAGNLEEGYELFKRAPEKDVVSWTAMITGFSEKGLTERCVDLFAMIPEKDDVAWTALISSFVNKREYEEAFRWFIKMLQSEVRPNPLTLSSMLSASAGLAMLNQGLQIHAYVMKTNMEIDLSIQSSLISIYSKCGSLNDAYRIFKLISFPNIVSFNAMITGFAQNGYGKEAVKLFDQLQNEGEQPNGITFLGVLSACMHAGLVEEGWNYFKSMRSLYNIEPGPDHYTSMVDILGRAGLLDEAVNLINSMPFKTHSGVWGALLAASKTHLRLDLAKLAAQRILDLEPSSAAPYVVLSDLYCIVGKKKDEEQVRLAKKLKRIKKYPGCSWVLLKNSVGLFLSGDQSHLNFEEISCTLWTILDEMKQLSCIDHDLLPH